MSLLKESEVKEEVENVFHFQKSGKKFLHFWKRFFSIDKKYFLWLIYFPLTKCQKIRKMFFFSIPKLLWKKKWGDNQVNIELGMGHAQWLKPETNWISFFLVEFANWTRTELNPFCFIYLFIVILVLLQERAIELLTKI